MSLHRLCYAPTFTKRVLDSNIAIGHICPKYAVDLIGEAEVLQAFAKTTPKPDFAILEWKGLNAEQRNKLISILEKNKIKWKKDKDIKN